MFHWGSGWSTSGEPLEVRPKLTARWEVGLWRGGSVEDLWRICGGSVEDLWRIWPLRGKQNVSMCVPSLWWRIGRGYRDDSSRQCCWRSGPLVSLSHSYTHTHSFLYSFFCPGYIIFTHTHTRVWNLKPSPLSICKGYLCDTSSQPGLWLISTHHTHLCTGTWQPGRCTVRLRG